MKKNRSAKNEIRNLISSNNKEKRKRNKIIKSTKNNFISFWFFMISLIVIIIFLSAFIYLKKGNILDNKMQNITNKQQKSALNIINSNTNLSQNLLNKISEIYKQNGFVNLNEVESTLPGGRTWVKGGDKSKEINVGSAINTKFVLLGMFTIASVMDSQKQETKLRLNFAVVEGFSVESMIKIYTLRDKIREDVEFNFYNAKKVETDIGSINLKGNAVSAKLILPELLPDDVERIIILDLGDTLVLRDLSEMYNWNMEDKIYYGVLDNGVMKYGPFSKKELDIYINTGSFLVDVKKVKSERIYEKIVENKNVYQPSEFFEQDILNDIAYGKIGYLPMRFGLKGPFSEDKYSDSPNRTDYSNTLEKAKYKDKYNLPKNDNEMVPQSFNPVVIHQWNGKWIDGLGLTIYRRIAQYYMRFSGIWDEICPEYPGLCKK